MRYLMILVLVGLVLASCSSPPREDGTNQESAASEPSEEANAPANPSDSISTEEADNPSAGPLAITVGPPKLFVGPIPGTPPAAGVPTPIIPALEGWQTFTSPDFGVSVDYPPDLSVDQQGEIITFTSPQGTTILLQILTASDTDNLATNRNQDCVMLINSYGLTADACGDIATSTYSASFNLESANSPTKWLILSTTDQAAIDIYKMMLNSVRLAP